MEEHLKGATLLEKKLHYKENVYKIVFNDGAEIPFRCLTYGEFRAFLSLLVTETFTERQILDYIYKRCVLDEYFTDPPPDHLRAGIPETIARLVLRVSAPESHNELIDHFQSYKQIMTVEEQMKAIIMASFPGYTLETLDDCTFSDIVRLFASAEFLQTWRGGPEFDFVSSIEQGDAQSGKISDKEIAEHNFKVNRG